VSQFSDLVRNSKTPYGQSGVNMIPDSRPIENGSGRKVASFFVNVGLLFLAAVLFALSHPNPVFSWGLPLLGYVALVPVVLLIQRSSWVSVWIWGAAYGFVSYALFNYWLGTFHPLALFIVPLIYFTFFLVVFPCLKLIAHSFPKFAVVLQSIAWIAYEYWKTQGFLAYSYGTMGYTQFTLGPVLQFASLFGIWGVTFLVVYPSFYIGHALQNGFNGVRNYIQSHRISLFAYLSVFLLVIVYGLVSPVNYSSAPVKRIATIQHNIDGWIGGSRSYTRAYEIMKRLSLEAEKENPDMIVWSETAFVPSILYHSRHREDLARYDLVQELLEFLKDRPVPYVIGNDHGEVIYNPDGSTDRVDYNSVMLFEKGELKEMYWKQHLVPFTEHFPYKDIFPGLYKLLVESGTTFWEKGKISTVFSAAGVKFSTPICFEDIFGYLNRDFVNNGAELLINLTNDSWSGSLASQMQHMSMAVFRAVENRRSMVRSTNSGMTCVIDPNGRILEMLPPFVESKMVFDVPVYTSSRTLYSVVGDTPEMVLVVFTLILLCYGLFRIVFLFLQKQFTGSRK